MLKNAIYGLAIADALGVPVEFMDRSTLSQNPVTDYRAFGTHNVPAGTWSDDTSMTLATLDSLSIGLDFADMMQKFSAWADNAAYTATGVTYDMGMTTCRALVNFKKGQPPLSCGLYGETDNGNGSLMRILPAVFYVETGMSDADTAEKLSVIHKVSALTHRHPRSCMACGIYWFLMVGLMQSRTKQAVREALKKAGQYYQTDSTFASEQRHYARLFSDAFESLSVDEIKSSGYVVDTLEAAVWCLLTTDSYRECVLKAVNLGKDTDTVAAVAGGLAGCLYFENPEKGIPDVWKEKLLAREQIEKLCDSFLQKYTNK